MPNITRKATDNYILYSIMSSFESDEEYFLTEYEQDSSEGEFCSSDQNSDSNDNDPPYTPGTQLSFELPNLGIHEIETPIEGSKKRGSSENSASAKRSVFGVIKHQSPQEIALPSNTLAR